MPQREHATFRLPASALFIPVLVFLMTAPLASASVWTVGLFLLPVYALFYVFWTRTVADDQSITAYLPLRRRRIQWADLDGFEFQGARWAIAVTLDGTRFRLPMVRPRDLSRLAAVSGGRLALGDGAAAEAEAAEAASNSGTTVIEAGEVSEPSAAAVVAVADPAAVAALAVAEGAAAAGPVVAAPLAAAGPVVAAPLAAAGQTVADPPGSAARAAPSNGPAQPE